MWSVSRNDLQMAEGDYGIQLPITVNGTTLTASDSLRVTIKSHKNGSTIVEKDYTNIVDNTINFELTAAESALLQVGVYVYSLDWYQHGLFLCNIIPLGLFKVVDKA